MHSDSTTIPEAGKCQKASARANLSPLRIISVGSGKADFSRPSKPAVEPAISRKCSSAPSLQQLARAWYSREGPRPGYLRPSLHQQPNRDSFELMILKTARAATARAVRLARARRDAPVIVG